MKHTPTDDLIYLLFLRLNQVSVPLSPQELRRALHPGAFLDWLEEATSQSQGMLKIFRQVPDFRMRDMEVATRHLAFRLRQDTYDGNLKTFLDGATAHFNDHWPHMRVDLQNAWDRYEDAISCTVEIFGANAFKVYVNGIYQSARNRAVMDIMTHFFAEQGVAQSARASGPAVKAAFEAICSINADFVRSLQTTTKSLAATKSRFGLWRDVLIGTGCNPSPLAFR